MKTPRCRRFTPFILGAAFILSLLGCANHKAMFIAKHVLGYSDEEVDLVGQAKLIPFEDLRFKIQSTSTKLKVEISSSKWEVVGFGTYGGPLRNPSGPKDRNVTEIGLEDIWGIPNPAGGRKSYEEDRFPGRKYAVIFVSSTKGERREIYRDR